LSIRPGCLVAQAALTIATSMGVCQRVLPNYDLAVAQHAFDHDPFGAQDSVDRCSLAF